MKISFKPLEIFCGTGGVGKTTLATSRALFLAEQNLRVLLITIDPSKRLKQVLGLDEEKSGIIETVSVAFTGKSLTLDAMLMSPEKTISRMAAEAGHPEANQNRIIKILTRPYGGMNEILAIVEVQHQLTLKKYDTIVLDTPPGSHFIDFLEAINRIQSFFDKSFVEIFKFLGKKISTKENQSLNIFSMVVSSGVKKLLHYLEVVTGKTFIDEFIDAISAVYSMRAPFLEGIALQNQIKHRDLTNWFLVTAVDHEKLSEAKEIQSQALHFFHEDSYILLNRCTQKYWSQSEAPLTPLVEQVKQSILTRENSLKNKAKTDFKNLIEFSEILSLSPQEQIKQLMSEWAQT